MDRLGRSAEQMKSVVVVSSAYTQHSRSWSVSCEFELNTPDALLSALPCALLSALLDALLGP